MFIEEVIVLCKFLVLPLLFLLENQNTMVLYKIAKLLSDWTFQLELRSLDGIGLFDSRVHDIDSIEHLYKSYLNQVLSEEIAVWGNYLFQKKSINIFNEFWKGRNRLPTLEEEEFLHLLLQRRCGKWFVTIVLRYADNFSQNMMKALLERGIKIEDPDRIKYFILPSMKVYEKETSTYLIEKFKQGNFKEQRGILRAHYHLSSKDNKSDWQELFLDQFMLSKKNKLKEYLSRNLPKTIDDFPIELKSQGALYLKVIKH